jgi:hypothetical protein
MSSDPIQSFMSAQQSAVSQQVQTAVVKKSLDASKAQGEAVVALLQDAVQLSKSLGKGQGFDAVG